MNANSRRLCALLLPLIIAACGDSPWNNPYPAADSGKNILYSSFNERPKHLDPVQSYSTNESTFTAQIYEPPLQYHYLKRPYTLVTCVAETVPKPRYLDANGREVPATASPKEIASTVYEIKIRRGIRYQPHPAFARNAAGEPVYQNLSNAELAGKNVLADFQETGTRELKARDFEYQIKRLAHPRLHSPILGLMEEYIIGLKDYAKQLKDVNAALGKNGNADAWIDLNKYPLPGVEVVDDYTYRIHLKGQYSQFLYWLAMPFFAPMPPEADQFFGQPGMVKKNLTLDWYPIGTGPYMLIENNPNRAMVLVRNPNFHGETYPVEGEPADKAAGLLNDAGKALPFIDKLVFTLEKEGIPRWNKFLQGYYDSSGIASDTFDQAVRFAAGGEAAVSDSMREQGIQLSTSVAVSTYYMGFNMLDPVVGGGIDEKSRERARKLRQAISIAVDYEEYISIFQNGRGIPAQGPLPPGIFGMREGKDGINPLVYTWDGEPRRRPIEAAKKLLAEAGYPNGLDAKTGAPLVLYFDVTARGAEAKSTLDWYKSQFARINVQLEVRPTDYNRFQDKIRKGNAQIFEWGWHADYPDPENFMFLLLGAQSKVKSQGENASNYVNPEFDRLFEEMKNMPNSPERQKIIDRMLDVLRHDAPWLWGFHPKDYALYHAWYSNVKPNKIAYNNVKYQRLDPQLREQKRREWNNPIWWPFIVGLAALIVMMLPAFLLWRRRERGTALA
ncbi:MAG: peptide transporter substrate-binding protein [Betaproteobacteria bacterium]|nr:peptide transporter substrate-binding protein [Betaproteobacteria bacterium]